MMYKPRTKPQELRMLESLHTRMNLPQKIKQHYIHLERGYEGELHFDSFLEKLESDVLILNDLLLKANTTTFQVDTIIISDEAIYCYEIKNYDGDYVYDAHQDKFFRRPNLEITNPLHQLARTEALLQQLLHQHGFKVPVKSYLVFIHDAFTLYQSPLDKPIIHPTQIRNHFQQWSQIRTNIKRSQQRLAEKLLELHMEQSPFTHVPPYDYSQLKKGIICNHCRSLAIYIEGRQCICKRCAQKEPVSEAVMRSVREFQLLFPDKKVTTNRIYDWCRVVTSKKRIKRTLDKHMKKVGTNRWIYYK